MISSRSSGTTRFAAANVGFSVTLRSQEFAGQYLIKHEFLKRLQARYAREGIVVRPMVKASVVRT